MSSVTSIKKSCAALALLAVFFVPSVLQFSHAFDMEDHGICQEKSEHMHEMAADCPICHFQLASFPYAFSTYPEFRLGAIPVTEVKRYDSLLQRFFRKSANPLRAPPRFMAEFL